MQDKQLGHLTERRFRADVAARHGFQLDFAHAEGAGLEATMSGPMKAPREP